MHTHISNILFGNNIRSDWFSQINLLSQSLSVLRVYVCVSEACHPYEPFKCPGDGICISIQYLCDGAPDCQDGYDEDSRLCTAGE